MGIFDGRLMAWASLFGMLPFVGYLLWVRKFFRYPVEQGVDLPG
jgi:hypothetical protein